MIHPEDFADILVKRLKDRRAQHVEALLRGQDPKPYWRMCGQVAEIDQLLETIKEVRRMEPDGDDDDPLTKPMRQNNGEGKRGLGGAARTPAK